MLTTAMQRIHLIGAPLDLGGNRRGTDMGPSAFRIAGMADHLSALGLTVVDKGDIPTPIPEIKGPGDPRKRYVQRDRQGLPASVSDRARLSR